MWYPTLPDVLNLHEQICAVHKVPAQISDMPVVDKAILAPQRAGIEERDASALATKSAAMLLPLIKKQPFDHCGDRVAYSLAQRFVDRNGFVLRLSMEEATSAFESLRAGESDLDNLSDWLRSKLSSRFDTPHRNRVFSALNALATVKEDLNRVPGFDRLVDEIDVAGYVIAQQMTSLFRLGAEGKEEVQDRFPDFWEAWQDALSKK